jgi:NAD(P) transhydrogenase subunit alpha
VVVVGVLAERTAGERRVALVPDVVRKLTASGVSVVVESGAGAGAHHHDEDYVAAGATIVPDAASATAGADLVVKVAPPRLDEIAQLRVGSTYLGFLPPTARDLLDALAARRVTVFSLDRLPRISRAQAMDALSSQALVAGYRATLLAAERLPRFLPMFMTAAGTVPPAKVFVIGAGVAGLQAIATARRLGAVVEAYDVRAAAAEEVRSMGATFLDLGMETQDGAGGYAREQSAEHLARQRELLGDRVAASDIVITTAVVPGREAPLLVTREMLERMRPGSVVVDLAAASGGNVEPSRLDAEVLVGEVLVLGPPNLASTLPTHASAFYARNVSAMIALLVRDGALAPDFTDEIVAGSCLLREGNPMESAA